MRISEPSLCSSSRNFPGAYMHASMQNTKKLFLAPLIREYLELQAQLKNIIF